MVRVRKALALTLLLTPCGVLASPLELPKKWLNQIAVEQPLLDYRLGMVSISEPKTDMDRELPVALRTALMQTGLFRRQQGDRVQIRITPLRVEPSGVVEIEYVICPARDPCVGGGIYRASVATETRNLSVSNENTLARLLVANQKLFLIGLRRHADAEFEETAVRMADAVGREINNRGVLSYVGQGAVMGLAGAAVGVITVAEGVGEVGKAVAENAPVISEAMIEGMEAQREHDARQRALLGATASSLPAARTDAPSAGPAAHDQPGVPRGVADGAGAPSGPAIRMSSPAGQSAPAAPEPERGTPDRKVAQDVYKVYVRCAYLDRAPYEYGNSAPPGPNTIYFSQVSAFTHSTEYFGDIPRIRDNFLADLRGRVANPVSSNAYCHSSDSPATLHKPQLKQKSSDREEMTSITLRR